MANSHSRETSLTHEGKTLTIAEWSRIIGIKYGTIWSRLKKGWTVRRVLSNKDERSNTSGRGTRSDSKILTHNGITLPLHVWAEKTKIKRGTITYRLNSGWSVGDALSTPPELPSHNGNSIRFAAEYNSWNSMKARCYHKGTERYPDYGGRGIRVSKRWYHSFSEFLKDMGPKPSRKHSLDRIDNNGHYTRKNCRWATPREQSRNRRNNHLITYKGESLCISEWAERTQISWEVIDGRLKRGWSIEKALHLPVTCRVHQKERSNALKFTLNGVTKSLVRWARDSGISEALLRARLKQGWDFGRALLTPPKKYRRTNRS